MGQFDIPMSIIITICRGRGMCFHYLKNYQTLYLLIKKNNIVILLDFVGERIYASLLIDASCSSGFPEASKVHEWCCTDKEPKDTKVNDMEEDVQDLHKDHEVSHTPSDVALNFYLLY
jgi:hypothetical protein